MDARYKFVEKTIAILDTLKQTQKWLKLGMLKTLILMRSQIGSDHLDLVKRYKKSLDTFLMDYYA